VVVIYEVVNQARRESVVAADARPPLPPHWRRREAVLRGVVETGVPRRRAASFMRWYQRSKQRIGWKVYLAAPGPG
jgi:hypothetical protein